MRAAHKLRLRIVYPCIPAQIFLLTDVDKVTSDASAEWLNIGKRQNEWKLTVGQKFKRENSLPEIICS